MNQEEIIINLTAHGHELNSLGHRVKKIESHLDAITELTVTVNTLAASVRDLLEVQRAQNERLSRLELRPLTEVRMARRELLRAVIGALAGAAVGALLTVLSRGAL